MEKTISCKDCGYYYFHRNNCIKLTIETGVKESIEFIEKSRLIAEIDRLQKELHEWKRQ